MSNPCKPTSFEDIGDLSARYSLRTSQAKTWVLLCQLAQSGALDHGLTVGTCANVLDLDSNKVLDVLPKVRNHPQLPKACAGTYLDVIASLLGQIVIGLRVGSRRLPSWHLVVNHLGLFQDLKIRRVRVQFLSIRLASILSQLIHRYRQPLR